MYFNKCKRKKILQTVHLIYLCIFYPHSLQTETVPIIVYTYRIIYYGFTWQFMILKKMIEILPLVLFKIHLALQFYRSIYDYQVEEQYVI